MTNESGQHAQLIEVAIAAPQDIAIGIPGRQQHVAASLGYLEAGGNAVVRGVRIPSIADARAHIELNALEVIAALEVDDAGHGVGAIHRRCAARDRFDAAKNELRDQVHVDDRIRVGQRQAPAIEQHQVARFAQSAQVERRATRERHRADRALRLALNELRQLIQRILDVDRAGLRDLFLAKRHDRAGRGIVRSRDARARHHDLFHFLRWSRSRLRLLRDDCAAREQRQPRCRPGCRCPDDHSSPPVDQSFIAQHAVAAALRTRVDRAHLAAPTELSVRTSTCVCQSRPLKCTNWSMSGPAPR